MKKAARLARSRADCQEALASSFAAIARVTAGDPGPCNKNPLQKPPREVARERPPEGGKFLISPELARNAVIEWPDVDLI